MATRKSVPTWRDVKERLATVDHAALLGLLQDLYAASRANQAFLHTRFGLGDDVLKPYQITIDRWLWPDVFKRQETSISKAKAAITDYRKAIGQVDGLAELMVFYCERAAGFSRDIGHDDPRYFDAWIRMYGQALKAVAALPPEQRSARMARLDAIRQQSHNLGYGVSDDLDALWAEYDRDG